MDTPDLRRMTVGRLIFAKRLFLHGIEHCERGDDFSRALAVHHFHAAVEATVRAALLHYRVRTEKTLNIGFEVMLNELDKALRDSGSKLPLRQEMRNLNTVRSLVQHHAYEGVSKAEELRAFTQSFLAALCQEIFKIAFDELSLSHLVTNDDIRSRLGEAEQHIANGAYEMAAAACSIAVKEALTLARRPYERPAFFSPFFVTTSLRDTQLEEPLERIVEEINRLQDVVELLCLGIDYVTYADSERWLPHAYRTIDATDNWYIGIRSGQEWGETEAWRAYNFALDVVMRLEGRPVLPSVSVQPSAGGQTGSWRRLTYQSPADGDEG